MPKTPRDLADAMAERRQRRFHGKSRADGATDDGYVRESFTLTRVEARQAARAFLDRFPKQAYMTEVEQWRELPDGGITFTMRRLRTAD